MARRWNAPGNSRMSAPRSNYLLFPCQELTTLFSFNVCFFALAFESGPNEDEDNHDERSIKAV
jgi:hypothetical protein